jgi:UDP-N-acetylglucosamine:LPS N-acetylglucosamine transferase
MHGKTTIKMWPLLKFFINLFGTGVLHLIQINHQPDATVFQFIILKFVYSSTCFGRFPAYHQELNYCSGSLWFYFRIVVTVVLCSWAGRPARPRTQHDYHHDTKVRPEAATAGIELLMMGGETSETC